jgi:endonuclease YncB( thermonuclease family)
MQVVAFLLVVGLAGLAAWMGFWPAGQGTTTRGEPIPAIAFGLCASPPHRDCVIDGDTFYLGRQSIRIEDIDAPETHPPRCILEADLGSRATMRLRALLNQGPFELRGDRVDRYDRELRTVYRNGRSLGAILVSEGLARKWTGRREPWCT